MDFEEFQAIVTRVDVSKFAVPVRFTTHLDDANPDRAYVRLNLTAAEVYDSDHPSKNIVLEAPFVLSSPKWIHDKLIPVMYGLVLRAVEHELRETFLVDSVRIYDPHAQEIAGSGSGENPAVTRKIVPYCVATTEWWMTRECGACGTARPRPAARRIPSEGRVPR